MGQVDVSLMLLPKEDPKLKKFSFMGLAGDVMTAVGIKKPAPMDNTKSKEVSKSKRRGPILQNIDLSTMDKVDEALRKKP